MLFRLIRLAVIWVSLAVASGPVLAQVSAVFVPEDRDAQDLIEEMAALEERGRLEAAAQLLHRVLERYADALIEVEKGRYLRVRSEIWHGGRVSADLVAAYVSLYEAEAERAARSLAVVPGELSVLEAHFDLYQPTVAGMRTGLDLAGLYLEAGRLRSAEGVLDVLGQMALPAGFHERYESLMEDLLGLSAWDASSDRRLWGGTPAGGVFAGPAGDDLMLTEGVALWEVGWERLVDAQMAAWLAANRPGQPVFLGQRRRPQDGFPVPVLAGDLLLISTGRSLVGLDRFSGVERWQVSVEDELPASDLPNQLRALIQPVTGSGLAVGGERAYAVLGGGSQLQRRPMGARLQGQAVLANELVAVDLSSGEVDWRVGVALLSELEQSWQMVGTPVVAEGRVFVVVQRIQAGSLAETQIAAFSAVDGELLWLQGVGTIGVARGMAGRSVPVLGFHDGSNQVVMVDASGLVVALLAGSGGISWLHDVSQLDGSEEAASGRAASRVMPVSRPRLLPMTDGLLLAHTDRSLVRVLDAEDGRVVAERSDLEPLPARFQVMTGGLVLSANVEPVWFDERLERVETTDAEALFDGGSVWFEQGGVLWSIGADAAEPKRWMELDAAARIAGHREQLVVSGPEGLRVFMAWPLAREKLMEAMISASGTDPRPALRLMEVAGGQGDRGSMEVGLARLEEVWPQWQVEASPDEQEVVFARLTRVIDSLSLEESALGLRGVVLLDALAGSSEQEAVALVLGARLRVASGRAEDAVSAYQRILQRADLSGTQMSYLRGSPMAGRVATREVLETVRSAGAEVYSAFDALAQTELEAARDRGSAVGLAAVAERYPASRWARPALELAGQTEIRQGRPLEATMHLRRAYRLAETAADAAGVLERVALAHEAMGLPERTGTWVRRFRADYPGSEGLLEVDVAAGAAGSSKPPLVWRGLSERGWRVPGLAAELPLPANRIVTRSQQVMKSWAMGEDPSTPVLAQRIDLSGRPLVLVGDRRGVVATLQASDSVIHMNHDDSAASWRRDSLAGGASTEPSERIPRPAIGQPDGVARLAVPPVALRRAMPTVLIPAVTDFRVVVSSQLGRVYALDRRDGQTVWHHQATGGTLLGLEANEWFTVLHGRQRPGEGGLGSWIDVYDTLSGEPVVQNLQPVQPIVDMRLTGLDQMVVIEGRELVVYSLPDGGEVWRRAIEETAFQRPLWVDGRFLAVHSVRNNVNSLRVYDLMTGDALAGFSSATRTNEASPPIRALGDRLVVRANDRLLMMDAGGQTVWESASPSGAGSDGRLGERMRHLAHWLTEERVLVWSVALQTGGQGVTGPVWSEYDLATGRLLLRRSLPIDWRQADLAATGPVDGGFVVGLRGAGTVLLKHEAVEQELFPGQPVVLDPVESTGPEEDRASMFLPRPQGTLRMPR